MRQPGCRARGFTLIEFMVVVSVVVILLVLTVPSFTDQLGRRKVEGVATALSTDLQYARAQTVANNATTSLTTNAGGTQYTITSGATTYKTVVLDSTLSITPSTTVTYDPFRAMASTSGAMTLSSTTTAGQLRVTATAMGRVSICSPSGSSLAGYTSC